MTTLVVCVDRGDDIGRTTGITTPVVGWDAVQSLITEVGLADPEGSGVNALLEALRVTRDLQSEEETVVALVSGADDTVVGADRAVARQMDELVAEYNPDSAIVVIDSAEDERLVPIIESRVPVDGVDRVVVRQAHDIESTYYLLKQFLGDEELRETVLVPIGVTLITFPIIAMLASPTVGVAAITAVIGAFLLYKGLGIDDYVADLPAQARDAFYSGRVSIVTYVVAAGLTLVGIFGGALGVSGTGADGVFMTVMAFVYHSVPWMAIAALAASTGRLFDEAIRSERLTSAYLNLPVGVIATGIVIRGFSAYFLQRSATIPPMMVPSIRVGELAIDAFALSPEERLALFVVGGVLVSLVGVRIAAYFRGMQITEGEYPE
ncbi:MAG: DUF373 family protein [Halobacteriales archaeon]|nr:DUF373 family protein [Halobacteriales archaeon]